MLLIFFGAFTVALSGAMGMILLPVAVLAVLGALYLRQDRVLAEHFGDRGLEPGEDAATYAARACPIHWRQMKFSPSAFSTK